MGWRKEKTAGGITRVDVTHFECKLKSRGDLRLDVWGDVSMYTDDVNEFIQEMEKVGTELIAKAAEYRFQMQKEAVS